MAEVRKRRKMFGPLFYVTAAIGVIGLLFRLALFVDENHTGVLLDTKVIEKQELEQLRERLRSHRADVRERAKDLRSSASKRRYRS